MALTERFVMDLALICLRNLLWRAHGSDGQICNGFGIDLLKKLTLAHPGNLAVSDLGSPGFILLMKSIESQ